LANKFKGQRHAKLLSTACAVTAVWGCEHMLTVISCTSISLYWRCV